MNSEAGMDIKILKLKGYLACCGDEVVGRCNANTKAD